MSRIAVRKTYKLFIGGAFPRSESGRTLPASNAQGGFVAHTSRASRKDFRNTVAVARKAQSGWESRTAFNRGQILYRIAEMLEGRRAGFEALLRELHGASADAATTEVDHAIDALVGYAGWCDKFAQVFGSVNPVAAPYFNFTAPAAMGVVTVLPSPTAPLLGLIRALAPVLAGGNTAIAVVEGAASLLAIELAEVCATSDVPGGVVNVLTGLREELLPHIGSHADVDAVWAWDLDPEAHVALERAAADAVKRVRVERSETGIPVAGGDLHTPYHILPFVEFRTAWHPIGS